MRVIQSMIKGELLITEQKLQVFYLKEQLNSLLAELKEIKNMAKIQVSTKINNENVEYLCEPHDTMLNVLRNQLNLTGSKESCGSGDCGSCSVILDGELVCSCLMLAAEAEGSSIETIEGMSEGGKLHALQQKFLEKAALQCGICTPGFLMASKALLDHNPSPTETEVRYWLAGNLCRCTGYDKIVKAVLEVADEMKESA